VKICVLESEDHVAGQVARIAEKVLVNGSSKKINFKIITKIIRI
jgi:hypothetical protein